MLLSEENEVKESENYWKDKYYGLLDRYANKQEGGVVQGAKDIIYSANNKNI